MQIAGSKNIPKVFQGLSGWGKYRLVRQVLASSFASLTTCFTTRPEYSIKICKMHISRAKLDQTLLAEKSIPEIRQHQRQMTNRETMP
jgi:hypothetical protein